MIVVADTGPLLHLHWVGAILEAARSGRISQAIAKRSLRELPVRGRLHVDRSLLQKVLDAIEKPPP